MTPQQLDDLNDCLDQDHAECHRMQSAGAAKKETVSSATQKALAGGISLKTIFAAIMAALASGGGVQGIIAAILALLNPANAATTP